MHKCMHELFWTCDGMRTCAECSLIILSRPVLPGQDLTKGGSAIASGCQQRARAR